VPIPFGQAIHHLLQGRFVTAPTFPVQQLPGVPIQGLPDPELLAFVLEIMPHLIEFQDDGSPRRLWLFVVVFGTVPDPGEHSLRGDVEKKRDAVHRHATHVPQDSIDLRGEGLPAWGRAGKLIATLFALFLRFASSRAIVDDANQLPPAKRVV